VINVNFTLIIQVINFIFLMWFLNKFLFKPVLKTLDERDKKITGDFVLAEEINREVDEGLEKLERELKNIRIKSNVVKTEIKDEGSKIANEKIEEAKKKAIDYLSGFQKELEESRKKVEESLAKETNVLAKSIASLLLEKELN
jgi:F-type H+-transporting ATPase subunit b